MTVQALIEQLGKYDSEMEVVIDGYEGYYSKGIDIGLLKITHEPVHTEWYFGPFDEDDENGQEVVYMSRFSGPAG